MLDSAQRAGAALYERHGRFLPGLAAALFVILLGRALADLVWALVPVPEAARWQVPPAPPVSARAASDGIDINGIVSAGLFGRYSAPSVETTLMAAPETPLNLTLIGVWADDREDHSRALIAAAGGEEKAYAIGDDVARGVTLNAIFPDRVILSRGGRLETLRLAPAEPGTAAPANQVSMAPGGTDDSVAPSLGRIREEVAHDPARAAEYIRVQPANVGGAMKGYRVYPGRERQAFSVAGLRPGDLVTSVNGVQLDDPSKALQLLGDLGQTGQVNLVVERGGQSQNLSINLSQ